MTRTAGLVALLVLAVICTVAVVGHSVGCKATRAEPTSRASPGVQETKFEPEELRGVLLADSDVSPFKVAKQVQFRWPGPEAVGPGVEQYVEAVGRPTVLVFLFGFDNDEAAKAGADFWAHSMAEIFTEGGLDDVAVGESCWVSVSGSGAALVFQRGPFCVSVGVITDIASERSIITEIAQKLDEKIVGYLGSASAGSTENHLANVKRLTKLYDFANWPGKDGGIRDGFKMDPSILPEGLVFKRIPVPGAGIDRATGLLSAGRGYVLTRGDGGGQLRIHVSVAETCDQAQERLIRSLVNTQMRQPPLTPRGAEHGLDIGDICFARRRQDGNFHSVTWVRNNIFVRMWAGVEDMRPFVEPLARALDAGILKRPTFKTYVECASRPVITRVARVTLAGLEAGLAVKWQAVEVHDPQGEEVVFVPSQSVLRSRDSVGLVRDWGGATFHIAVNESNLIGFPLPGIAEWKQNGPEPEEVNARINAFLKKFEQPSQSAEAPPDSQAELHWFYRGVLGVCISLARLPVVFPRLL